MSASEIGIKELLPQKDVTKTTLIGTSGTIYWIGYNKKISEEMNTLISSKYLINTQLWTAE